ncbi:hypothetical protein D0Y60_22080 [Shinella sp. WSJ-2]|uniref:hypothetical protein n=1 Tax=Shinella sp. WSJ-2 TaxID=2303749 RepID=UPI000E3B59D7|nr:hypothetical protein [Shinella sp. WSJ-2]RFZ82608.1 hypothetical protein D0Y60_22080 [Shinella sp. WSJ-2]
MTVTLEEDAITLRGVCGVEEVEDLVGYMERRPDLPVDLGAATTIHTALWQALMVFKPVVSGTPASPFAAGQVLPALHSYLDENRGEQT